jgi:hypothetical protein
MLILRHLFLPEVCQYTGLERLKLHDGGLVPDNRKVSFHILAVKSIQDDAVLTFMTRALYICKKQMTCNSSNRRTIQRV